MANFHSHTPSKSAENFSGSKDIGGVYGWLPRNFGIGDTFVQDNAGCPGYLVTPKGDIKRYDPDPKKEGNGQVTKIGTVDKKYQSDEKK